MTVSYLSQKPVTRQRVNRSALQDKRHHVHFYFHPQVQILYGTGTGISKHTAPWELRESLLTNYLAISSCAEQHSALFCPYSRYHEHPQSSGELNRIF